MEIPFELPEWLQNQTAEAIQQRMMNALPPDIDNTDGGFPWDFTMPTALEKAELLQFFLPETLKIMFPQWAYDRWLEYHAASVGLTRKPANAAYGVLRIEGIPGTEIPHGFVFAVPAVGSKPAIEFYTEDSATIGDPEPTEPSNEPKKEGSALVGVIAMEAGPIGNVPADTITIMATPMKGITAISNPERTSGGVSDESDDDLRERVLEKMRNDGTSFVGCDADYVRWAKEVPGVGDVFVLAQWDSATPNSVKVVALDANGEPANDHILRDIYQHIMSPDDRLQRLAPIGSILTVAPPEMVPIRFALKAVLEDGYDTESVRAEIVERIRTYYITSKTENLVMYNEVHAIITKTSGIYDFTEFTMNGDIKNILLAPDQYPSTEDIDLGLPEGEAEV